MVSPQLELEALQSIPGMVDGSKGGQQLPVKSRILTLCCGQLLGEEAKWLSAFYFLLLQDTPMWVSDASVANDSSTWGSRCASGTASTRVSLMAVKDTCMSVDYTRTFGLPFSPSVRGCSLQATAGRNLQ